MKKSTLGLVLFLVGAISYLILSIFLAVNQYVYNDMTGTIAALLGNEILIPYIIFCSLGLSGLFICVYEAYFRK